MSSLSPNKRIGTAPRRIAEALQICQKPLCVALIEEGLHLLGEIGGSNHLLSKHTTFSTWWVCGNMSTGCTFVTR